MPAFDRATFLNSIEKLALLFDNGSSSTMGSSIRRDAELLLEAVEWDLTHNTTLAQEHAKKIFDNANHIRGYQDMYIDGVTMGELVGACLNLAESVSELAGVQFEKPTSKFRRMLKKFGTTK